MSSHILNIITTTPLVFIITCFPNRPSSKSSGIRCLYLNGHHVTLSLNQCLRQLIINLFIPLIGTSFATSNLQVLVSTIWIRWQLLILDKIIEILIGCLRMPSQRMTINRHICILRILDELLDCRKIHTAIIFHTRSHFHGITSSHFIEIATSKAIYKCLLVEFGCFKRNAQLKVGIALAGSFHIFHVFFQRLVIVQILIILQILGHISSVLRELVISTRRQSQESHQA